MKKPSRTDLRGAVAGILAAAGGVGASLLLASLVGSVSSPIYALGTTVIGITPGWLKDFAVEQFGTNDKNVLLGSVFVVMAIASVLVGVVATRNVRLGLILAGVLNLIALGGAIKTLAGLEFSVQTILPGLLSLVVSVALLWLFTRSWSGAAEASAPKGFNRRTFLEAALASGGVAVIAGGTSTLFGKSGADSRAGITLPAAAEKVAPVAQGVELDVKGITPYLTSNKDFYRVDVALQVPQLDANTWRLKVHGSVENELDLSYSDILDMPLEEKRITLTCVSNQVGEHYVGNAVWLGVPTRKILEMAGVKSGADCWVSSGADNMTISTPLKALTDERPSMLVIGMNGEPLPLKHGFPARLIVPGLYGFVSATKWLTDLEVTKFDDVKTYWTQRGWSEQAPIKTESRIDTPGQFVSAKLGSTVNVAGVAYAQQRGIKKVEIKVDQGDWQEARLAKQDNVDTWRQWVFPWKAETSGQHKFYVRATDDTGYTQTSERVPPRPDGATGQHTTTVNVT